MTGPLVIYCDASVGKDRSGWGAVFMRGDKKLGEASGAFSFGPSLVAEFEAASNALAHAFATGLFKPRDEVVVVSDNVMLRQCFDGNCGKRKWRDRWELMVETADKVGIRLSADWVKAHQPEGDECPRGLIQKRCDKLARIASGVRQA